MMFFQNEVTKFDFKIMVDKVTCIKFLSAFNNINRFTV